MHMRVLDRYEVSVSVIVLDNSQPVKFFWGKYVFPRSSLHLVSCVLYAECIQGGKK